MSPTGTPATLLGIDAGGTKLHFRVLSGEGETPRDLVFPAGDWTAAGPVGKARILAAHATAIEPAGWAALGVGAHGCDSDEECDELQRALAGLLPDAPVRVVNDAFLLPLAGSTRRAAGVVIGTGSIAVAAAADGRSLYAGGWGWLLGDHGSAWGTVRDAVTHLADAADQGEDVEHDPLLPALRAEAGVSSLRGIADTMQNLPAQQWAEWAPAVFRAAADGSPSAGRAVADGVESVVALVGSLIQRGAVVDEVVAGGGVVVHQPAMARLLADRLSERLRLPLRVFRGQPVEGAIVIARELTARPPAAV